MSFFYQPVQTLKGVGTEVTKKLQKLGIFSVADLLFHLPTRYQDRTKISLLATSLPGDTALIEGDIVRQEMINTKRPYLRIILNDGTGVLHLRFFHFNQAMRDHLDQGKRIRVFGEMKLGFNTGLEMIHPEIRTVSTTNTIEENLTPIYPLTAGFSQKQIRSLIQQALARINDINLPELLPALHRNHTFTLLQAIHYVHAPPPDADIDALLNKQHPAQQRLALEEIVAHQLSLKKLRQSIQAEVTLPCTLYDSYRDQLIQALPFQLTRAQQRVIHDIDHDLAQNRPMLRLIQGDVGSGKTIVAAMALLRVVANHFQGVFMAPTELLAEQHFLQVNRWCQPFGIVCVLLSGSLKAKQRRDTLAKIADGTAQIIIGTHAVFQSAVEYHALNLVIIDEQHRFGVAQRLQLKEKGKHLNPHQLMMTATPIPRTLAMCAYADLDSSIIDELPPNRTPVTTTIFNQSRRQELITRLQHLIRQQQQAYWVCTLIEESDAFSAKAAQACWEDLQIHMPSVRIGLVHGRMKASEKEAIMLAFKAHELDVLVATTVIEVGVDVPNASLIVIENTERLGLSQLHQLRGRVGRGHAVSHCVLLYAPPLSAMGRERLNIMKNTTDGFKIAEYDLKLRGPGEVLGTRQTGSIHFKIADLSQHAELVETAKTISEYLLAQGAPALIEQLTYRWIGQGTQYGTV